MTISDLSVKTSSNSSKVNAILNSAFGNIWFIISNSRKYCYSVFSSICSSEIKSFILLDSYKII